MDHNWQYLVLSLVAMNSTVIKKLEIIYLYSSACTATTCELDDRVSIVGRRGEVTRNRRSTHLSSATRKSPIQ
jgi:hypothetical protein